eukprot:351208-Chlamydomonas_euryale.AAC.4
MRCWVRAGRGDMYSGQDTNNKINCCLANSESLTTRLTTTKLEKARRPALQRWMLACGTGWGQGEGGE